MPPVVTVWIIDDSRRSSHTWQTHPSEGIGAAEASPKGNHPLSHLEGLFPTLIGYREDAFRTLTGTAESHPKRVWDLPRI